VTASVPSRGPARFFFFLFQLRVDRFAFADQLLLQLRHGLIIPFGRGGREIVFEENFALGDLAAYLESNSASCFFFSAVIFTVGDALFKRSMASS
jgi:hypothetical protein